MRFAEIGGLESRGGGGWRGELESGDGGRVGWIRWWIGSGGRLEREELTGI